jgi:hypothetical protein
MLLEASPRILEIGGGYGGMALRLYRHAPNLLHYVDIDLADTLYIAYAFLAPRMPAGAVVLGYDPQAAISLVPEHAIPGMEPYDLVVNFRSFGEMDRDTVARYFRLIEGWAPPYVFHENASYINERDSSPQALAVILADQASKPHKEFLMQDYPPLNGYQLRSWEQSPWEAGSRYMRAGYTRIAA